MKTLINLNEFSDETRERMAKETKDVDLLDELAKDQREKVRCAVAENLYTKQDILEQFAKEDSHLVKRSVARNVKIKRSIIDVLFNYGIQLNDTDNILFSIATRNYDEPHRDLLIKLASHQDPKVRFSLSRWGSHKIKDDEEILEILLESSSDDNNDYSCITRRNVASMTTDIKKLEILSTDIDWCVLLEVIQNPIAMPLLKNIEKHLIENKEKYIEYMKKTGTGRTHGYSICLNAIRDIYRDGKVSTGTLCYYD